MILLNNDHIQRSALIYGLTPKLVDTVATIESGKSGYYLDKGSAQGHLKILFEGHYFHRLTKGKWDKIRPDLSHPKWIKDRKKQHYRKGHAEFARFKEAIALNPNNQEHVDACLKSASWGKFQIMGENYKKLEYETVSDMILDFYQGEHVQLNGFLKFCANTLNMTIRLNLIQILQDFEKTGNKNTLKAFVEKYNGKGQIDYYADLIFKTYYK